jgi:segregation and condensation protein B
MSEANLLSDIQDNKSFDEFLPVLEALIFASDEPLQIAVISDILQQSEFREFADADLIAQAILSINSQLSEYRRPYTIIKIAGGYHFVTLNGYGMYIQRLLKSKSKKRMSQAALETLAIIAYKQPVTKPDIESIRGVNSGDIVNSLLDRELITMLGRSESLGRPLLYGTSSEFLRVFGLNALEDLPKMKEIEELIEFQPQSMAAELSAAALFIDDSSSLIL